MSMVARMLALVVAGAGSASLGAEQDRSMIVTALGDVVFRPVIPSRPNGPQIAVLRGNPDEGPSDMLLKTPRGNGPLHTHTADYHLTIVRGEMKHWDSAGSEAKARRLGPGSYWFQPGGEAHGDSCLSDECVMFIHWAGKRDARLAEAR